jgi:hypothetical protein
MNFLQNGIFSNLLGSPAQPAELTENATLQEVPIISGLLVIRTEPGHEAGVATYWLGKIRYLNDSLRRPVLNIYLSNLNTHNCS